MKCYYTIKEEDSGDNSEKSTYSGSRMELYAGGFRQPYI
jgi:hypothetical protein